MRLIDDFYHSNQDLLPEGIRLHYLTFLGAEYLPDTLEITQPALKDLCQKSSVQGRGDNIQYIVVWPIRSIGSSSALIQLQTYN